MERSNRHWVPRRVAWADTGGREPRPAPAIVCGGHRAPTNAAGRLGPVPRAPDVL